MLIVRCLVGDHLFGLLFGGYEEYLLASLGYVLESSRCFFELGGCLVEVDDVDTVALHEDVGGHGRIPFTLEVAEVATCFKELFKCRC